MKLTYRASDSDEGRKVYHILKNELRLSGTQIKRLKQSGSLRVEGEPVFTDRRLTPGETLEADLSSCEAAPDFPPERGALDILFEDGAYLAVNKPAGMLTHPSRGKFTGTLANLAAGYLLDSSGSAACHAVNRLDRDTSGVVLFAKSAHFKNLAIQALRQPGSGKIYTAYLFGSLPEGRGVIDLPIDRDQPGLQRRVVRPTGRPAVTEYETTGTALVEGQLITRVRLRLLTGRTHQIRVHCAHLGAPVVGDSLYHTEASLAFSQAQGFTAQLLHAAALTLHAPQTGALLTLTAPVTRPDMIKCGNFFKNSY